MSRLDNKGDGRQRGWKLSEDLGKLLKDHPELEQILTSYLDKDTRIVLQERNAKLVKIESENYLVIDTDVLKRIKGLISESDHSKLTYLGEYLKTKYNILFNNTKPFTLDTLSKQLGINKDNTSRFINRMVAQGLMMYAVCAPSGYVEKIYSINPMLMRRGKYYDEEFVKLYFNDLSNLVKNEDSDL